MRSGSREKRGDEEEAGLNTLRPTSNAAFPSKNKQIRGSQCEICGLAALLAVNQRTLARVPAKAPAPWG